MAKRKSEDVNFDKEKNLAIKARDAVINALDQNGNGEIDIVDIIVLAMKTPGIHISRSSFLQKELFKNHTQDVVNKAIESTPAKAGISPDEIDKIADETIKFESGSKIIVSIWFSRD